MNLASRGDLGRLIIAKYEDPSLFEKLKDDIIEKHQKWLKKVQKVC